jgi:ABC-type sulfate transport system permease component
VVIGLLLLGTRLPRWLIGMLLALMGVGLLADIGGWWLARLYVSAVYAILIGGAAFNGASGLALVLTLLDLWWPRRP